MRVKTTELIGRALDWAVSKALGHEPTYNMVSHGVTWHGWYERNPATAESLQYRQLPFYATSWKHAGPIIEREDISFRKYHNPENESHGKYYAKVCRESGTTVRWKGWGAKVQTGPTPLVASMRCLVAAKLGDEVEVPEQLLEEQES